MAKVKIPSTAAIRLLKQQEIPFTPKPYAYVDKGGTAVCARELGVSEHAVIKTLLFEDDQGEPIIVLMHGDQKVSTKALARLLGKKTIAPCPPQKADRYSGYQVGGTSPFGTRRAMPVYMEKTIEALDKVYINGGKKGLLLEMTPQDVVHVLQPTLTEVGITD